MPFSSEVIVKELRREIAARKRLYPRWVAAGRMKQVEMDRRIEIMESVIADYLPGGERAEQKELKL